MRVAICGGHDNMIGPIVNALTTESHDVVHILSERDAARKLQIMGFDYYVLIVSFTTHKMQTILKKAKLRFGGIIVRCRHEWTEAKPVLIKARLLPADVADVTAAADVADVSKAVSGVNKEFRMPNVDVCSDVCTTDEDCDKYEMVRMAALELIKADFSVLDLLPKQLVKEASVAVGETLDTGDTMLLTETVQKWYTLRDRARKMIIEDLSWLAQTPDLCEILYKTDNTGEDVRTIVAAVVASAQPTGTGKGRKLSKLWDWHQMVYNYAYNCYTKFRAGAVGAWPTIESIGRIMTVSGAAVHATFTKDIASARATVFGAWAGDLLVYPSTLGITDATLLELGMIKGFKGPVIGHSARWLTTRVAVEEYNMNNQPTMGVTAPAPAPTPALAPAPALAPTPAPVPSIESVASTVENIEFINLRAAKAEIVELQYAILAAEVKLEDMKKDLEVKRTTFKAKSAAILELLTI